MISVCDKADIVSLGMSGISCTLKVCDGGTKIGLFKKQLNISALAVAYDKQRHFCGKGTDGVSYTGLENVIVAFVEQFMFSVATGIDKGITIFFF